MVIKTSAELQVSYLRRLSLADMLSANAAYAE